jgi:dienelactone hydrolase
MNDTRPAAFRPQIAQDAWGRLLRFLATHLRG